MGELVLNAICAIFGSGGSVKAELSEWMSTVLGSLLNAFQGDLLSGALDIFAGIACSLLIIYFFMDLTSQASRDMFSFEKLIVGFIKLFVAFAVLLCLKEIMTGLVAIGYNMFEMLKTQAIDITDVEFEPSFAFFGVGDVTKENLFVGSDKYKELLPKFQEHYGSISVVIDNVGLVGVSIIMWVFSFIIKIAGYFLVTSCALNIIIKGFISPIAVVQLFEDGTRSVGARHIKSFAAECITMAIMILILSATEALTNLLFTYGDQIPKLTQDNIGEVFSGGVLFKALLPQLAGVGAMMGAGRLTKEMIGA